MGSIRQRCVVIAQPRRVCVPVGTHISWQVVELLLGRLGGCLLDLSKGEGEGDG